MRITQATMFRNSSEHVRRAFERLFIVQEQLASGKRVQRPSDDAAAIGRILDTRSARRHLDQVRENIGLLRTELSLADSSLQQISDVATRARELAVQGVNGGLAQEDRDNLAQEVDLLLQQLLQYANERGATGSLFGGSLRQGAPFELVSTAGRDRVNYLGDDTRLRVDLGDALRPEVNLTGHDVFSIGVRQPSIYGGVTGAAAGSGTDSLTGSDVLRILHDQTLLGDGLGSGGGDSVSGLAPGASSAAADTALGTAHSITLVDTSGTGASGTVSLNGGDPVSWTNTDGDLRVVGPDGEVLQLDLRNVTAGFNGTVGVDSSATATLDGGRSSVAVDFTDTDLLIVDEETGESLFVDATGIRIAGDESVHAPGTYDLFATLIELRDQLENRDDLDLDLQLGRIQSLLDELDRGSNTVLSALGEVGARVRMIDSTESRTEEFDRLLAQTQSSLEDTDFATASIELGQADAMLQAALSMSARIAQMPSLLQIL